MTSSTKAFRRLAHEQALASTRIEGYIPSPEFIANCQSVVEGSMTRVQARAAGLARALASYNAATVEVNAVAMARRAGFRDAGPPRALDDPQLATSSRSNWGVAGRRRRRRGEWGEGPGPQQFACLLLPLSYYRGLGPVDDV